MTSVPDASPVRARLATTMRMRSPGWLVLLAVLVGSITLVWSGRLSPAMAQGAGVWPELTLTQVTSGLTRPVHLTHGGDGSGRIFIVEQPGRIRILQHGTLRTAPFLEITSRVRCCNEEGLLSVAFPPDYANKGHFYVYYVDLDGDLVIARFRLTDDPNLADPASEQIVLVIPHPQYTNHNGGQLAFGPHDGFLYAGPGDGGGSGDPFGNAQNPVVLLGKLLRIDVETENPVTYTIPATNPYTQSIGYRPEIWALGLRNPWRFSFDRQTHDLYIADVGQHAREEVNVQPAESAGGENYGWNILEGTLCFNPPTGCEPPDRYSPPVAEHATRDLGCAITGGFVYRGPPQLGLNGTYLYGDYCSGRVWGLRREGDTWQSHEFARTQHAISTFGEDEPGNLYLADLSGGTVYQITARPTANRILLPLVYR